jgi:hypothetical protein
MNFAFKPEASASTTLNLVLLFLGYYFFHQELRTETRLKKNRNNVRFFYNRYLPLSTQQPGDIHLPAICCLLKCSQSQT